MKVGEFVDIESAGSESHRSFSPKQFAYLLFGTELYRSTCLLLNNDRTITNTTYVRKVGDLRLDHVTAAQLAFDGKIEHGAITKTALVIQSETDGPDLLSFQRYITAELSARVPRAPLLNTGSFRLRRVKSR